MEIYGFGSLRFWLLLGRLGHFQYFPFSLAGRTTATRSFYPWGFGSDFIVRTEGLSSMEDDGNVMYEHKCQILTCGRPLLSQVWAKPWAIPSWQGTHDIHSFTK